jgi:triphosphatase
VKPVKVSNWLAVSSVRKKILKQGKRLNDLTTQKRHKLRIRAKKLRYASEFFRDVFPGKKKARKRKLAETALKELQSALGELNDISARERMMSEVTMQEPISSVRDKRKLSFAAGIVYGSQKAQVEDLMHEAKKANRKFAETKAFWK